LTDKLKVQGFCFGLSENQYAKKAPPVAGEAFNILWAVKLV